MSFRITTNGLFRNYRSNLQHNTKKLNDSMLRVQTQRKFNSYAEDPAAASKAFQLRRNYWRAGDQIETSNHVISKFTSAYSAMAAIVDGDQNHPALSSIDSQLMGISDSIGSGRVALGQQLTTVADSIVSMMNTQYSDDYIFAGADGANVPFTWKTNEDGTKALLYRDIDVSAGEETEDYKKLQAMANEPMYVDIGLGMREDNDGIIPATAFDMSLSGIEIMGYGKDKNLAVMMKELGEIFSRADSNSGAYDTENHPGDPERAMELVGKIHTAIGEMTQKHVELTTDTQFLKTNLNQLESYQFELNVQIEETERMEPAQAITEMGWAQYCYNAALRIGNNILSQSLIDYMN